MDGVLHSFEGLQGLHDELLKTSRLDSCDRFKMRFSEISERR